MAKPNGCVVGTVTCMDDELSAQARQVGVNVDGPE